MAGWAVGGGGCPLVPRKRVAKLHGPVEKRAATPAPALPSQATVSPRRAPVPPRRIFLDERSHKEAFMESEFQVWRARTPSSDLGTRRRFTEQQRLVGVGLARRAIAAGISRVEVCKRMDISEYTLRAWEKRKPALAPVKPALVPVKVVADVVDDHVRLVMGRMHAVLSVGQLAELARRLW